MGTLQGAQPVTPAPRAARRTPDRARFASKVAAFASASVLLTCVAASAGAQVPTSAPVAPHAAPSDGAAVKLVLLGTKGGPSQRAFGSFPNSQVLLVDGTPYVVDAGYGVTRRLLEAGVALPSLRYVFITHHHSDHNLEFGNLLYNSWANGLKTPVDAYGPTGLMALTRSYWESNRSDIETRIADEGRVDVRRLIVAHDIQPGVVLDNGVVKVTAMRNHHPPIEDSYAFKFETHGKIIVFSGDTAYYPPLAEFAKNADLLVHEAMYGPGIEALAKRIGNGATLLKHLNDSHTRVEDVGRIAQAAGVKTLVLTHFVPGEDPSITPALWEAAAKSQFSGRIVVGSDLATVVP